MLARVLLQLGSASSRHEERASPVTAKLSTLLELRRVCSASLASGTCPPEQAGVTQVKSPIWRPANPEGKTLAVVDNLDVLGWQFLQPYSQDLAGVCWHSSLGLLQ